MPVLQLAVALFLALAGPAGAQAFGDDLPEFVACVDMLRPIMAHFEKPGAFNGDLEGPADKCLPYLERVLFKDYPACSGIWGDISDDAELDQKRCEIAREAAQIYTDLLALQSKLDGLIFKAFPEMFAPGTMLVDFPAELNPD